MYMYDNAAADVNDSKQKFDTLSLTMIHLINQNTLHPVGPYDPHIDDISLLGVPSYLNSNVVNVSLEMRFPNPII